MVLKRVRFPIQCHVCTYDHQNALGKYNMNARGHDYFISEIETDILTMRRARFLVLLNLKTRLWKFHEFKTKSSGSADRKEKNKNVRIIHTADG